MYQMTGRGREFTFSDVQQKQQRIVVTELIGCQTPPFCRRCVLYEYSMGEQQQKNFKWTSGPLISMQNGGKKEQQIQVLNFEIN